MRRVVATLVVASMLVSLAGALVPAVTAAGVVTFDMTLVGGERTVSSGEYLQYRFTYSCSGLDSSCGATTITDDLDADLEYVDLQTAGGFTGTYDPVAHRVTISHPDFLDGSSSEATLTVRVRFGVAGGVSIPNTSTITYATPSSGASGTQTSATWTVTTAAPTPQWSVTATKSAPSGNPAPDGVVTYTLGLCADTGLGNVDLAGAQLVDTIPDGTVIVDAGGGTVSGSTVTWDLGTLSIATLYAGTDGTGQTCTTRTLQLRHPASAFPSGSTSVDTVVGYGDTGSGAGQIGSASVTVTVIDPVQSVNLVKAGDGEDVPGGTINYTLRWDASASNVDVDAFTLTDSLPTELDLVHVRAGTWTPSTISADVEYSTDGGATWTTLGTVDGTANTTWTVASGTLPAGVTDVRWTFFDDTSGTRVDAVPATFDEGTRPRIRMTVPSGYVPPGTITNCATATWATGSDQSCTSTSIIDPIPRLDVAKQLLTSGDISPGDEIQWELRIRNTGYLDLTDPLVADLLPAELDYVSWDAVVFDNASSLSPAGTEPNLEVIEDYGGTGRTLLRWSWSDTPPAGAYRSDGSPAVANPTAVKPWWSWIRIRFTTRVVPGTSAGSYTNTFAAFEVTQPECRQSADTGTDTADLDGDGDTSETVCTESAGWTVIPAAVVSSQLWVSADAGLDHVDPANPGVVPNPTCPALGAATRYPCVARTVPGGTFTYHLVLENSGNIPLTDYVVYDILPWVGDTAVSEVLASVARNSGWQPDLEGPIVAADATTASLFTQAGGSIAYSLSINPCRPEVSASADETGWQTSCVDDWTTTPSDWTLVRAFRITMPFSSTFWSPTTQLRFDVPMRAPHGAPYDSQAWNSVAHRVTNADSGLRLSAAEPRMVGIEVPSADVASAPVGFDLALRTTISGLSEDPLVPGTSTVTYAIDVFNQGSDPATEITVTDTVPAGLTFLAADNPGWTGTDGTSTPTATVSSLAAGAQTRLTLTLRVDAGTTGQTLTDVAEISAASGGTDIDSTPDALAGDPVVDDEIDDDGTLDEDDHDIAVLTVGTTGYRVGELVWADLDADGVAEAGEPGIADVTVELWADDDATPGASAGDTRVGITTTAADGTYAFHQVPGGDYYVVLPGADGTGPDGWISDVTGQSADPDDDVDNDDNGAFDLAVTGGPAGVASGVFTLALSAEPTDETTRSGSGVDADTGGVPDARSNFSVDFGFHRLRVGNLVFYDDGAGNAEGNAVADSGEAGLAGVEIQIYRDLDADGRIDAADPLVDSAITDAAGHYAFDGLAAATTYLLGVPAGQTGQTAGGVSVDLDTLESSYGTGTGDNTDHGSPATSYAAVSAPFTLSALGAPTGETDGTTGADAEAVADAALTAVGDANSDLTLDFGFAAPVTYALGDLVFEDLDADGVADVGEPGIAGVTVELWSDEGSVSADAADTLVGQTTTDTDGHWLFTDLAAGDYYVVIPDGQAALASHRISPGTVTDPDDDVDNDSDAYATVDVTGGPSGTVTRIITLGNGADRSDEPTDEETRRGSGVDADPGTVRRDDRSNLSLDLGFYRLSIGNRVWLDADGDGLLGSGETGLAGVAVTLRDAASDAPVATTTTDTDGHYLFAGLAPGAYVVEIDAANFAAGGPLEYLVSTTGPSGTTTPDSDIDGDDDGVDPTSWGQAVRSGTVTLTAGAEPTGETDDNDTATPDTGENLTVDFGFTALVLGNRVWFDSDADGTDTGEAGIAGVTVELRDAATDALVDTTTTDTTGAYRFVRLAPGDYVVEIPASMFTAGAPLAGLSSVTTGTGVGTDNDDDGLDPVSAGGAVRSATVTLAHGSAPTGENPDTTPSPVPDADADLTVDFGFHGMAIGNRVFFDTATVDGLFGAGEVGAGGVPVELHLAADGSLVAATTSDAEGRYLFTGVQPGVEYVVRIPAAAFADGGPLEGYANTTANGEPAPDPDDGVDGDDNGVAPTGAGGDVDSLPLVLAVGAEPTGEDASTPDGVTLGAVDDANADLTVDFGFTAAATLAVGNRVWKDLDADGTVSSVNEAAAGVADVTVELYRDDDADGVADRSTALMRTTTDASGYYLFTGVAPGSYLVGVPAANFADGGALAGWYSTAGVVGAGDENDDGIDPALPGDTVYSGTVTLAVDAAPTGEADKPAGGLAFDTGGDANSDTSIDFGFTTISVGNRVFYDDDADGVFDEGIDRGIDGVTLELWSDLDGDGTFTLDQTTVTAAGGFYEFGGLANGTYKVVVAASNFDTDTGRLDVLESSPGATPADDDVDGVDDGLDPTSWGEAVETAPFTLTAGAEPLVENPDPYGQTVDANYNLTVDFAFRRQCLIGGMVWYDTNGDGVHQAEESPAAGVGTTLYDATTGAVLDTGTTDAYGWYLFEHLTPGVSYRVAFDDPALADQFPTCNLYC
ncbi:MAG: DUF11 domain-containing protein [Actinomyces sp.]|nr:MAG: DUF11 domain-containing protein [Actinomyces sp.]